MWCRRHSSLAALFFGVALAGALAPSGTRAEKKGDCGHPGVNAIYEGPAELEVACAALIDIVVYFQRVGFEITPKISLRFDDRDAARSFGQAAAHGYFNAPQSRIVVYRTSDVNPWGLVWSTKLAASFLRHELAHMAVWEILRTTDAHLKREWHEFIAYAIQLDLMDGQTLNELLARYAEAHAVGHLTEINQFTSGMNPEVFAVIAYKTYLAKGGTRFLGQLLRGDVLPPTFSYPFPALPD